MNIGTKKKTLCLEDQMKQRSNNLELMKFLAAWLVIIHHAFDLNALPEGEWMMALTGGKMDFGTAAVSLFFLASGLFIAKSMERTKNAGAFFRARMIRVWPPLAVVVLGSVVMGAFVTTLPLYEYLTNGMTWKYLLNSVFVLQHSLPGVFEHNVYGSVVNGALWTLPVEVACYVGCFLIYKLGMLKRRWILGVMGVYLACAIAGDRICSMMGVSLLSSAFRPIYFFLLGHTLYVYRDKVPIQIELFIGSCAGMILCFLASLPVIGIWVFYPYILLYLAFMGKQCMDRVAFVGRFSYTIYLCAFPLQQLIIYCYGGKMNLYLHMIIALIVATIAGVVLHYGVEGRITR